MRRAFLAIVILSALVRLALGQGLPPGSFRVSIDPSVHRGEYSGTVYLVLGSSRSPEPRLRLGDWFGKMQVLAVEVERLMPGEAVEFNHGGVRAYPNAIGEISPGEYWVQAVADRSPDSSEFGNGPGDLYSEVEPLTLSGAATDVRTITLTKAVARTPFRETDRVKLVEFDSPLLTSFYGRPVASRAAVRLPKGWTDDPEVVWPTLYLIGGFGSDHSLVHRAESLLGGGDLLDRVLLVVPDPSSGRGHTVFADSANNGPRGRALIEEMIPAVEARFHGARGDHTARFVTGLSSGGWSSLWLQISYPDHFNGCWSHCPDPVDFRDFQRINLYEPGANMYRDEKGERRPIARMGSAPRLWYEDFVRQEDTLGPGGQIHAFEAVFSPRLPDGRPRPLFDRATGLVDLETAKAWEPYDIRLILERRWDALGPKLKGKVRVFAGGLDTFYLEGAVERLKESLSALGSDAVVEVVPRMAHTFYRPALREMMRTIAGVAEPEPPAADPGR
ncbi:MAG: enterochelin esterase [Phycisphaeraceae bacterium]|nr:MAG: enterochelin esterase [Phycisphaeraceae bacterium]